MKRKWMYIAIFLSVILVISPLISTVSSKNSVDSEKKPTPIGVRLHFYTMINGRKYPISGAVVTLQGLTPPFARKMFITDKEGYSPTLIYIPAGIYKYFLIWWQHYPLTAIGKIKIKITDNFKVIDVYIPINSTNNQEKQHDEHNTQQKEKSHVKLDKIPNHIGLMLNIAKLFKRILKNSL